MQISCKNIQRRQLRAPCFVPRRHARHLAAAHAGAQDGRCKEPATAARKPPQNCIPPAPHKHTRRKHLTTRELDRTRRTQLQLTKLIPTGLIDGAMSSTAADCRMKTSTMLLRNFILHPCQQSLQVCLLQIRYAYSTKGC